jgi:hypothetical protein
MVRQAKSYLVGAMSGAGLIAIALVAFVLLVSALVFEDFPVAGLVGGGEADVSSAEPAGGAAVAAGATGDSAGQADTGAAAAGGGAAKGGGGSAGGARDVGGTGPQPTGGTGETTGGSGGGGDASGGSTTTTNTSGGSGGGAATSSSGGGGGGGSGGGGEEGSGSTTTSTSGAVTNTVNETVNQVDQTATGGALEETGVTQVTEEVVNGAAGPESTVGKTVDETVKTVEGVLGK